ncbi:hypothetical protein [Ruegeria sp.]
MRDSECLPFGATYISPEPAVYFCRTLMQMAGGENCYLVKPRSAG